MSTLLYVILDPNHTTIAVGTTAQFSLTGYYDDNTVKDLTGSAIWGSDTESVATIDDKGLVTAVAVGMSMITGTSGGKSASVAMNVVYGHHLHVPPPVIMNTPLGHLKFWHSFTYNTPQVAGSPDPYGSHISFINGNTVIVQSKPLDVVTMNLDIRADIPAPGLDLGQVGRMIKDPATPIVHIVEAPTSSDSTSGIWVRGKIFAGKIPNW